MNQYRAPESFEGLPRKVERGLKEEVEECCGKEGNSDKEEEETKYERRRVVKARRIKSNELAARVIYRLTDQGSCYDPILPMYPACYLRDKREAEMRAAPEVTTP